MSGLFRKTVAGTRYSGSWVQGHWVVAQDTPLSFTASVQPTRPFDLQLLDSGRRERKSLTLYTDFPLIAFSAGTANPDQVTFGEQPFEVTAEAPWKSNSICDHYKYIITLMEAVTAAV